MGYRSDVTIWLNKKALENMPKQIEDYLNELANGSIEKYSSGNKCYCISGIKWYGEEIEEIEDFLDTLKAEDGELYEWMRIGDDEDDNYHGGNVECFQMYLERSANIDFLE